MFAQRCAANCTRDDKNQRCDSVYRADDEKTFELSPGRRVQADADNSAMMGESSKKLKTML